jgi:hypothetical protein
MQKMNEKVRLSVEKALSVGGAGTKCAPFQQLLKLNPCGIGSARVSGGKGVIQAIPRCGTPLTKYIVA